jgi:hypothetical protein
MMFKLENTVDLKRLELYCGLRLTVLRPPGGQGTMDVKLTLLADVSALSSLLFSTLLFSSLLTFCYFSSVTRVGLAYI